MEEKQQLKIKFSTVVILVILFIGVIAVFGVMFINKNKEEKNKNTIGTVINPISDADRENIEKSDFSLKFLKIENNEQNMIYSPLSIKYALKMLNEGANGNTKTQIENVVGNLNLEKYNNIDKVLSLANSLYIRDTYSKHVKDEYKSTLTTKYGAEINIDSFKNANNINKWIENKTLGIIKNMLQDQMVQNPDTQMLLINALAIEMEWQSAFDASDTSGKDFTLADNSKMIATTLNKETSNDSISYYKDSNITSLTMDLKEYNGTQLQFTAIMPKKDLSEYIKTVKIEEINKIINNSKLASETENGVNISIPKFSFEYNLKLKQDLQELGIKDAFDDYLADFTNIVNKENMYTNLYVSDALHKANIDFSEEGIKAAAVTVFALKDLMMAMPKEPEQIKIDRPFIYIIKDKKTGEIWFVGTVYKPNSWAEDSANYQ